MKLVFPSDFKFGTSTAAYQIETAFQHDWKGVVARDGNIFDRTTDHEKRYDEDIAIIASLAPNYRMSLMWSRLQRGPFMNFDEDTKAEYHTLLQKLKSKGIDIMMVLHHFANPVWFAEKGGWESERNISMWVDYATKVVKEYGKYVSSWNTFNEPNLYTSLGWIVREFPPFKNNIRLAKKVINNIANAHNVMYDHIKHNYPDTPVGISLNTTVFAAENIFGRAPAALVDWLFMEYPASLFQRADFFGMSYYARIGFDPLPITYLNTPEKIRRNKKPHDDMWEYYPKGLKVCIDRFWKAYGKPIIITENGICTSDDRKRVQALKDYMLMIHQALHEGVPILGYYHWSTWDNFEWNIGPSYQFGLYGCDLKTKERTKKPSADIYTSLAYNKVLDII